MALLNAKKKQKSYRTQFSGAQLLVLVCLVGMSLLISFYLGLVTGKSLRTVNETSLAAQTQKKEAAQSKPLSPEELEFFNSLDSKKQEKKKSFSTDQLEKLRKNTERLSQEQQPVKKDLSQGSPPQKTSQMLQTPTSSGKDKKVEPAAIKTPPTTMPKVTVTSTGTYTLQVFTSSNKKKAETLVKRLKEGGYLEAYLNPYVNAEKQTLYRVRVGKTNKESAESLAIKLKALEFIENVQITRL
ncbi:MAG: SPOR domain-containing protein [SAR324 cluster bacterium]|nr:SPOR domain-containing protein [SAR324 cluster bacterium]